MAKITRFIVWVCSKFTRLEIEQIIAGLSDILNNRNPEVKPKDDFKENHPNYRNFSVDPLPPLTEIPIPKKPIPEKDFNLLLSEYQTAHGKPLLPVKHYPDSEVVPKQTLCPICNAPHIYLYYNDGNKRSQLRCKICGSLFQLSHRFRKHDKAKFFCPYCHNALFKWKERIEVSIYKCCNDNCPQRINALNKLNPAERLALKTHSSQFKLCYQYREYHYKPNELLHSTPYKPKIELTKIHNAPNVLGLILTFYVSFAVTARKTALIMRTVFNINVSYQTVLNYAAASALHCHNFNLQHKGPIDNISAGDETYIKVMGKHNYVFFFISSKYLKITAYNLSDNRGVQPAIAAMNEAIRTKQPDQDITLISDGNPSYPAGIHFINSQSDTNTNIKHHKVIGLQNLDKESEEFRPFKQLIERLNRTYKYHVKPSHGFNSTNGAIALTTLFVTHYNFLRPHMSLNYKTPVHVPELQTISNIQGKWAKILSLAA